MKIIILARLFYPETGGIQTYTYELANQLSKQGHEVVVLCPHSKNDQLFDETQPFKIIRINFTKIVFPFM